MSNTRRKKPVVNSTVTEDVKPLVEVKKAENTVEFLEGKVKAQDKIIVEFSDRINELETSLETVKASNKELRVTKENANRLNDRELASLRAELNKIPNWIQWIYGIKS
jgi:predicted RNase H-like nuclease (RuvC/YqgF family)